MVFLSLHPINTMKWLDLGLGELCWLQEALAL